MSARTTPIAIVTATALVSLFLCVSEAIAGRPAKSVPIPQSEDGHPSLEGVWTNGTLTPLERSIELGNRAFFTAEEMAVQEKLAEQHGGIAPDPERTVDNVAYLDSDYKLLATRQSSLIVDPPNGRVPLRDDQISSSDAKAFSLDNYESLTPWDRCISFGATTLFPKLINNGYRIVQTRDYIVIAPEMISDARVIPIGNQPHADARIQSWLGDSRAHWDRDTLVIDTINFNNRRMVTSIALGVARNLPQSDALHTIERLRRIDANTIDYRITFEDSTVFTQPWTASLRFTRHDDYRIFEYACHEGNAGMEFMLRGARAQEAETENRPHAESSFK
jgi:hypothetical protein